MECQICKKEKETGSYYEFHYGNSSMSDMGPILSSPTGRKYLVTTRIEGSRRSWICRTCVIKGSIMPIAIGIMLCALLPATMALRSLYTGEISGPIATLVAVFLFICLCVGISLIGMGIGEIGVSGENRAIDANSSELREAGFDEFLNHREYKKFKKKSMGL
jgi:hypothetical protein